jgi:catechol 2,3-dioxygenase-like lactoylglutathione lyase family enzyme
VEDTAVVGSVMVDCNDLEKVVGFWEEILGLEERMRFPGYVFLGRMSPKGPRLALQQVPEPKTVKNRVHLDLGAADPEAFIVRAMGLGATRLADHDLPGIHWTVMADPEGNEFCVAPAE